LKSRLLNLLDTIRASYWFIPALMAFAAIGLSFGAIELDAHLKGVAPDWINWLFDNQPDGARAVLSTIAGSMITVAGVVFSITLVTVSNAAFNLGPRLLSNYMRDRANQITLGTFIATFLYCLLVLRSVQSVPAETSGDSASEFVPHLALLFALFLAVCSIAVLIHFIHHVPQSIHVSHVLARIGLELCSQLDERFPKAIGHDEIPPDEEEAKRRFLEPFRENGHTIQSSQSGYIRMLDSEGLMNLARRENLHIVLKRKPGDFVCRGEVFMSVVGLHADQLSDELRSKLTATLTLGTMRSPMQDLEFLAQELSEIAIRALSPGINDPVTAITAMDWLTAALTTLGSREPLRSLRLDEEGQPRVLTPVTGFESLLEESLGGIAPYAATNPSAGEGFLRAMERLYACLGNARAQNVRELEQRFRKMAKASLTEPAFARLSMNA
jgi:uncharacterized membrane protein